MRKILYMAITLAGTLLSGGCQSSGDIRRAYQVLRASPTEEATAAFLAHGDAAIRFIGTLPEDERHVVIITEDKIAGQVLPGGPSGMLRLKSGLTPDAPVRLIRLDMIRRIAFVRSTR